MGIATAQTTGSTTSSFNWMVATAATTRAQIRIRALDGSGAGGASALFRIEEGPIHTSR
jgi:hypothetical protein